MTKKLKLEVVAPKFRPTQDRVQFERLPKPAFKPGEIVIPREPDIRAKVISVGPKCRDVKPGMIVFVNFNVGQPAVNTTSKICREDDILAILP